MVDRTWPWAQAYFTRQPNGLVKYFHVERWLGGATSFPKTVPAQNRRWWLAQRQLRMCETHIELFSRRDTCRNLDRAATSIDLRQFACVYK